MLRLPDHGGAALELAAVHDLDELVSRIGDADERLRDECASHTLACPERGRSRVVRLAAELELVTSDLEHLAKLWNEPGARDEVETREVLCRAGRFLAHLRGGWHDGDERLGGGVAAPEPVALEGGPHDPDVHDPALEELTYLGRRALADLELHLGEPLPQLEELGGGHQPRAARLDAKGDRPAHAGADVRHLALRCVGHRDDLLCALVEDATRVGERDATGPADHELRPELFLEFAQLIGERRLRDVEPPGSRGDLPLLCDRHEILELP